MERFDVISMGRVGVDLQVGVSLPNVSTFGKFATVSTLQASASAISELAAHQLIAMVEPFLSRWGVDGRVVNDLSPAAVARSVAIASGLGGTSAYTWLKLPVVEDMAAVMAATTLPALLLGGDPMDDAPGGHPSGMRTLKETTV
ncbi:Cgl0159 family (beta/alpha)8-fold protein [Micromonospora deserti]|uniref:Cgl0159 family (beta/alpha)8-fold protein n=1 Tax=Micromonospora deserti TaxID=2070366 RepID=UPI0018F7BFF2|nr:hypothetical protein [Micromonospora deserti]